MYAYVYIRWWGRDDEKPWGEVLSTHNSAQWAIDIPTGSHAIHRSLFVHMCFFAYIYVPCWHHLLRPIAHRYFHWQPLNLLHQSTNVFHYPWSTSCSQDCLPKTWQTGNVQSPSSIESGYSQGLPEGKPVFCEYVQNSLSVKMVWCNKNSLLCDKISLGHIEHS